MRPKITHSNVSFYLRQNYGFKNMKQFFEFAEQQPKFRKEILTDIIRQFTSYKFDMFKSTGNLVCYNPYTNNYEGLNIKTVQHITNSDELLKELSMLHKTRMRMFSQSRKRILELSKKKKNTRDEDLQVKPQKAKERLNQLSDLSGDKKRNKEIER